MKILTDVSRMPFGKFLHVPMGKIEADYLLYIWEDGLWDIERLQIIASDVNASESMMNMRQDRLAVAKYIRGDFSTLEMDAKDIIVTHRPK